MKRSQKDIIDGIKRLLDEIEQRVKESGLLCNEANNASQEEPTKPIWSCFLETVKAYPMTESLRVACVAQAINESARGTSGVANECLNFHGMKMRDELKTVAYGKVMKVTSETSGQAEFACFANIANALRGWFLFLSREYYRGWEAFENDTEGFIHHIGKSWCPDSAYIGKLLANIPEARKLLGLSNAAPRNRWKIFLDPGHSKRHPGARSNDHMALEEVLNYHQCQIIKRELESTGKYSCTIYDPPEDDLADIGKHAAGHDMSLHPHHNCYEGAGDPGTEVLYDNDKAETQSRVFAAELSSYVSKALGTKDRGAKPFAGTVMDVAEQQGTFPVVLPESYFLNPYNEIDAINRSTIAARAMISCIRDWFEDDN